MRLTIVTRWKMTSIKQRRPSHTWQEITPLNLSPSPRTLLKNTRGKHQSHSTQHALTRVFSQYFALVKRLIWFGIPTLIWLFSHWQLSPEKRKEREQVLKEYAFEKKAMCIRRAEREQQALEKEQEEKELAEAAEMPPPPSVKPPKQGGSHRPRNGSTLTRSRSSSLSQENRVVVSLALSLLPQLVLRINTLVFRVLTILRFVTFRFSFPRPFLAQTLAQSSRDKILVLSFERSLPSQKFHRIVSEDSFVARVGFLR